MVVKMRSSDVCVPISKINVAVPQLFRTRVTMTCDFTAGYRPPQRIAQGPPINGSTRSVAHVTAADLMADIASADLHTDAEVWGIEDEAVVDEALSHLTIERVTDVNGVRFQIRYAGADQPPIIILQGDRSSAAETLEEFRDAHAGGASRVRTVLENTVANVRLSRKAMHQEDMGVVLASRITETFAFAGNGLIYDQNDEWWEAEDRVPLVILRRSGNAEQSAQPEPRAARLHMVTWFERDLQQLRSRVILQVFRTASSTDNQRLKFRRLMPKISVSNTAKVLVPVDLEPPWKKVRENPTTRRASNKVCLQMTLDQYLKLLDWTGRQLRRKKAG
jgi:hypothetical protein